MKKYLMILPMILYMGGFNFQKQKTPIVLDFTYENKGTPISITKQQEKEVRKYFKENDLKLISKEEAEMLVKKQMSEIINPFYKTAAEDLPKLQEEAKAKLSSMPESSRWIHYTFYSADKILIDSVEIDIFSSPFNLKEGKRFKKSVVNSAQKEIVSFLNTTLDTCLANNFFN